MARIWQEYNDSVIMPTPEVADRLNRGITGEWIDVPDQPVTIAQQYRPTYSITSSNQVPVRPVVSPIPTPKLKFKQKSKTVLPLTYQLAQKQLNSPKETNIYTEPQLTRLIGNPPVYQGIIGNFPSYQGLIGGISPEGLAAFQAAHPELTQQKSASSSQTTQQVPAQLNYDGSVATGANAGTNYNEFTGEYESLPATPPVIAKPQPTAPVESNRLKELPVISANPLNFGQQILDAAIATQAKKSTQLEPKPQPKAIDVSKPTPLIEVGTGLPTEWVTSPEGEYGGVRWDDSGEPQINIPPELAWGANPALDAAYGNVANSHPQAITTGERVAQKIGSTLAEIAAWELAPLFGGGSALGVGTRIANAIGAERKYRAIKDILSAADRKLIRQNAAKAQKRAAQIQAREKNKQIQERVTNLVQQIDTDKIPSSEILSNFYRLDKSSQQAREAYRAIQRSQLPQHIKQEARNWYQNLDQQYVEQGIKDLIQKGKNLIKPKQKPNPFNQSQPAPSKPVQKSQPYPSAYDAYINALKRVFTR